MSFNTSYKDAPAPILTIFGANGNLATQKLLPSLYALLKGGYLPKNTKIVCVTFQETPKKMLLQQLEIQILHKERDSDPDVLKQLEEMIVMLQMNLEEEADYGKLREAINKLDEETPEPRNRLFYLAIPPSIFKTVLTYMHNAGLHEETNEAASRILIEKPFGTDLESARDIVQFLEERFKEEQIYRIDHYLAKETAQNIMVFRSENPLIADIWGRQYIDHIQITAAETNTVGWRSHFYEKTGALRDIVQSHLLQLMTLVMMEIPPETDSKSIHADKLDLLNSIEIMKDQHVDELAVRGQYLGYGEDVENVASTIETFAAIKLEVINSRWGGVPVLLRTGKALSDKRTEIRVVFKDRSRRKSLPNILTIWIQPNEGVSIELLAKEPGFTNALQPVHMNFKYASSFAGKHPDAYERVLLDAIIGDSSLFATSSEVIRSWEIVHPILKAWTRSTERPIAYPKGSMGPEEANDLAREYGNDWIDTMPKDLEKSTDQEA